MSKRKFVNANLSEILQNRLNHQNLLSISTEFSFSFFSRNSKVLDINLKTTSLKDLDLSLLDFYASFIRNRDEHYKRNMQLCMHQAGIEQTAEINH